MMKKKTPNAMPGPRAALAVFLCAFAAVALVRCGESSSTPANPPTPTPGATPTPSPTPQAAVCNPTPPPLYGMRLEIRDASGFRKRLAATPLVINDDEYCGKVGFYSGQLYCETRMADDPLRAACDAAAVGRASDTNRWGPTWFFDGGPCAQPGTEEGCENHESDQFQAYAKGHGEFEACAAPTIPVQPDGSRCGSVRF